MVLHVVFLPNACLSLLGVFDTDFKDLGLKPFLLSPRSENTTGSNVRGPYLNDLQFSLCHALCPADLQFMKVIMKLIHLRIHWMAALTWQSKSIVKAAHVSQHCKHYSGQRFGTHCSCLLGLLCSRLHFVFFPSLAFIYVYKATFNGHPLSLINTHLESTADFAEQRKVQLKKCFRKCIREPAERTIILAGDLNLRDSEVISFYVMFSKYWFINFMHSDKPTK